MTELHGKSVNFCCDGVVRVVRVAKAFSNPIFKNLFVLLYFNVSYLNCSAVIELQFSIS